MNRTSGMVFGALVCWLATALVVGCMGRSADEPSSGAIGSVASTTSPAATESAIAPAGSRPNSEPPREPTRLPAAAAANAKPVDPAEARRAMSLEAGAVKIAAAVSPADAAPAAPLPPARGDQRALSPLRASKIEAVAASSAVRPASAEDDAPARGAEPGPAAKQDPPAAASTEGSTASKSADADKSAGKGTKAVDRDALRKKIRKYSGVPFDPIKVHGEYFKDWPDPKFVLVITGREDGYMEPCGCAGMDFMKGGLSRRMTFLTELRRQRNWPVLAVDVGGLNDTGAHKGFGKQAELKFQNTVDALRKMNYDAIAMGRSELRLPTGELLAQMSAVDKKDSAMFLSSNVALFGFSEELTPARKVCRVGNFRVGVTAVLGDSFRKQINNTDLEMVDAEAGIRRELPHLQKADCDLLVLLAHATIEESVELAKKFPEFRVVVTAGGAAEPPKDEPQRVGKTMLIEVGEKGMAAVALGFFDDSQQPIRYQRVLLDSRYKAAPEITQILALYQERLKDSGLENLGVKPRPLARIEKQGGYVGSISCEACHEESWRVWKRTHHSKAFRTLEEANPPRQHDPECISCHVVGWDPQGYFPYQTGFLSKEKTPKLLDVGCEACHGPGGRHVDAEAGSNTKLQEEMRKAVVVTKADAKARLCGTCHDLENSPDFNFDLYWPIVEHYEPKEKE